MHNIAELHDYLSNQGVVARAVDVLKSIIGKEHNVAWSPIAGQLPIPRKLTNSEESMSLASMASVHMLDLHAGNKLLDVCSAPGMKSLYASKLVPGIVLYTNDLSGERLRRLGALFAKHNVETTITNMTLVLSTEHMLLSHSTKYCLMHRAAVKASYWVEA